MEVHHQTHPVSERGHRKKWTHYFWEFLMLFLAVTLGFFVENQREHYVERQRAREYAKSLVDDLAKDTIEILDVIREDRIVLDCFDSIRIIIQKDLKNNFVPGSFYYYCNVGTTSPTVVWSNATLTQITQSGSLRYFRNAELVKKISSYYSQIEYITSSNNNDKKYREKSMELRSRVLNNLHYSKFSLYGISNWLQVPDSLMKELTPLQSYESDLVNEFVNSFENRRSTFIFLINRVYEGALKQAAELMLLLKKEYNLK